MNEQPYADPANPPKPDLTSREVLTKKIEELAAQAAQAVAENNPKNAAVALLQENALLRALMVDELQATQQMFERHDKKIDSVLVWLHQRFGPPPAPLASNGDGGLVIHERAEGELPQVTFNAEQQEALTTTLGALEEVVRRDPEGLHGASAQLVLNALVEYRDNFVRPRGS